MLQGVDTDRVLKAGPRAIAEDTLFGFFKTFKKYAQDADPFYAPSTEMVSTNLPEPGLDPEALDFMADYIGGKFIAKAAAAATAQQDSVKAASSSQASVTKQRQQRSAAGDTQEDRRRVDNASTTQGKAVKAKVPMTTVNESQQDKGQLRGPMMLRPEEVASAKRAIKNALQYQLLAQVMLGTHLLLSRPMYMLTCTCLIKFASLQLHVHMSTA